MNCPIMIFRLKAINLRPPARLRWLRKELLYSRKHTDGIVSRSKRKVWRQDSDYQHGLPEKLARRPTLLHPERSSSRAIKNFRCPTHL